MHDLNQRRMRYFFEVWRNKTIRGAAESLNTAPSVITRQIKLLEEEVGVRLFDRKSRGVEPTDAALLLLEYWRGCKAQQENFEEQLRALKGLQDGNIRIALSEGFIDILNSQVLGKFSQMYPGIKIFLDILPANSVVNEVAKGKAHFGIAYNPSQKEDISYIASCKQPIKLLLKPDHQLTKLSQPISLNDIIKFPIAIMPTEYGIGQAINLVFDLENISLTPVVITNSLSALRHYVLNTNAVSFIAEFSAFSDIKSGKLTTLYIDNNILNNIYGRLIVKKLCTISPSAQELINWIIMYMEIFSLDEVV
ncbi:LysR family transcriptional regulator [Acinetobacter bereziniae]|uniref:LysR family transcriptional regulator n=1 Tax=Acinetobacter bereziniae TaxID=106648 RepID=UPI0021CD48C9|nr:LysR family transcriptional regulator [Acinetobacter bereziniae]MCU4539259.1 LysR family transcriptional regulator [Acinetobacter bereziniae]